MKIVEIVLNDFIENNILKEEEYELYYYCFDILFSKFFFLSILLIIAFVINQVNVTMAYYVAFSVIRYTSGGYHANSPGICFALSIAIYLVCIGLINIVPIAIYPGILFGTLWLAFILILKYAPVDHPNKKFSPREKNCYQMKSRMAIVCCALIALLFWDHNCKLSWAIALGCMVSAISIAIAKMKVKEGV